MSNESPTAPPPYPRWGVWLLAAAHALFVTGYIAFSSDHTQYLLLPFRDIVPDFATNDWLTWETSHYHFTFSYLIRGLHALAPNFLDVSMFAMWFLFTGLYTHACLKLTQSLGGRFEHFCIVVLLHGLYMNIGIGDTNTYGDMLLPTHMAFAITMYAIAALLQHRYVQASAFLGIATLIHIAFGAVCFPVLIAYMVCAEKKFEPKRWIQVAIPFLLISLPNSIPVALRFAESFIEPAAFDGFRIAFQFRAPQHYDPLSFSTGVSLMWAIPIFVALTRVCPAHNDTDRRARLLLVLILGLLVVTFVASIAGTPRFLLRFFPWRLAPIAMVISFVYLARACTDSPLWRNKAAAAFLVPVLGLIGLRSLSNGALIQGALICGVILAVVAAIYMMRNVRFAPIAAACLCAVGLTAASATPANGYLPQHRAITLHHNDPFLEWIREESPPGALFMIPPDLEGIRLQGQRAVIVNFKCFPLGDGDEILEWTRRIEAVTGSEAILDQQATGFRLLQKLIADYKGRSPDQVLETMDEFAADYFVTYEDHCELELFDQSGFELCFADTARRIYRRVSPGQ
ncbi:MAG: DUF6798 domain-containing protein [Planctomycetota bacterium]